MEFRGAPFYRMEADAETRAATIHVYGPIVDTQWWYDEVAADSLVKDLDSLDVDSIELRVNSPGGMVYAGVAIMNALARHPAKVTAWVDGLAASAATVILLGADEVVMCPGAELMIHDASSFVWGQAAAMRKEAESLDRVSNTIADLYSQRAGGSASDWRDAMLAETWYSADEAVKVGLANRVVKLGQSAEPEAHFDRARAAKVFGWQFTSRDEAPDPFTRRAPQRAHTPAAVLGATNISASLPRGGSFTSSKPHGAERANAMEAVLREALVQRFGLPADADDAAILAAAQADPPAATLPDGVVTIDAAQLEALQADAAAGREARDAQVRAEREATVDAAVADGRIAPARRDHWIAALTADPGSAEVLAGLAKGMVPLEPVGYTGGINESGDEDRTLYTRVWPDEKKEA